MTLRFFGRFRPLQSGFSLLEMLVAVMFIGILTAGMLRIYSANLAGFQRVNDIIASQRRGRWALTSLQDDAASIGYFALAPFNQPTGYSVAAGSQEPFMILPAPRPVLITGPNPANLAGAPVTAPLSPNPDELQFVGDLPLPIQARVAGTAPGVLTVEWLSGSSTDVQPGDIVAILDAAFEQIQVGTAPGSSNAIGVSAAAAALAGITQAGGYPLSPALSYHQVGTPIAIYRPNMVTRYSIQPRSWDPSNPAITVPCLVRQHTPYPSGGAMIDWTGVPAEVVAENIEGFVVDLSFDGGTTWLRQGAADWNAIVNKINDILNDLGGTGTPVRDSSNPLWFRRFPFLVRMDITSRSASLRAESADAPGQVAYVRRTQTLMVAPRNFGLPL